MPAPDIRTLLQTVATVLIRNVGGASGPLYGTFFLRASAACAGKMELDAAGVVSLFQAGVEGVRQRGKAEPGDKTMVDALEPALAAMQKALAGNDSLASDSGRRRDGCRGRHAEHHSHAGAQGAGELSWPAQHRPPGPGRDLVLAADPCRCEHVERRWRRVTRA